MKACFLLLAAFLSGHLLFAQAEIDFPEAIKLSYTPKKDIPSCKVDAKSSSSDSGEFYLLLTFKRTFAEKFRNGDVEHSISLSFFEKPRLYLRPIYDSCWTNYTKWQVFNYVCAVKLNRSEIDFLKTNKVETLAYVFADARATLRFSRRSRKALMKLFNDHW